MRLKEYIRHPLQLVRPMERRGLLNWMPDKQYLKLMYAVATGNKLNLSNPKTFNEKIQWLKLYDRQPEYTTMVDKYEAKRYVEGVLGANHIIPTLGVWNRFDDIDFDALPRQFVLKCTHDSGGLVICRNKDALDKDAARKKIEKSLNRNYFRHGREWPYKHVKPRILAEAYMEDGHGTGLRDYKFFCFHGEPKLIYVSEGLEHHPTASISFLTMDWEFAPFGRSDYKGFAELPQKPELYEQMIQTAKTLAGDMPFVRVDLYEIKGNIYFSELTFSPCGGMLPFEPRSWDETIGEWIDLPSVKK